MDPHSLQMPYLLTSLSPSVHDLITKHTISECKDDNVLNYNKLLDFSYIGKIIPENRSDNHGDAYFLKCVTNLAPILHSVHVWMEQCTRDGLFNLYGSLLQWTGQEKHLLDVWEYMFLQTGIDELIVLLVTTAVLERALGDLYLLKGPAPCPLMLKDLLTTPELQEILGTHVIDVLRVIIGPPESLNIRNIAWHGFPFPGEIPRRCVWFVILLVPSIGQLLRDKDIEAVNHREPVIFPLVRPISEICILEISENTWLNVITKSRLIGWITSSFWLRIQQLYHEQRYSLCSSLLLYYIEQGLRRVFATINNCEQRLFTAEASTLFTTFDEMLCPYLPDDTENQLRYVIGDQLTEILLDHLSYELGPRVRDRLSHGEALWSTFPGQLTCNLVDIAVILTYLFIPQSDFTPCSIIEKSLIGIKSYIAQFHTISLLKEKIRNCSLQCSQTDNYVLVTPDLNERSHLDVQPMCQTHDLFSVQVQRACQLIAGHWKCNPLPQNIVARVGYDHCDLYYRDMTDVLLHNIETLYVFSKLPLVPSKHSMIDRRRELLTLLHHVIDECITVITNIHMFVQQRQQQLVNHQLRSRQRENLKKLLHCLPVFVTVICLVNFTISWQLYHLDDLSTKQELVLKAKIRFWKSVLQFCENLRTCSQTDKNKWDEGHGLVVDFVNNFQNCLGKQLLISLQP